MDSSLIVVLLFPPWGNYIVPRKGGQSCSGNFEKQYLSITIKKDFYGLRWLG